MNELANVKNNEIASWNTSETLAIIKNQLTKDLTDTEFKLFIEIAKSTGLNPLKRQIYAVKRGKDMTIQTGIDGYRSIAMRSGLHLGTSSATFEMKDSKTPLSAKITVKKLVHGHVAEFEATAYWDEYAQYFFNKEKRIAELGKMWVQYPKLMLSKCAEALALRRAFPEETAGTYIEEEINERIVSNDLNQSSLDTMNNSSETKKHYVIQKSKEEIEEERNLLLDIGRSKAEEGVNALDDWFSKQLSKQERILIGRSAIETLKQSANLNQQYNNTLDDKIDGLHSAINNPKEVKKEEVAPKEPSKEESEALEALKQFDSELVDMQTGEIL